MSAVQGLWALCQAKLGAGNTHSLTDILTGSFTEMVNGGQESVLSPSLEVRPYLAVQNS